jgi:hypothetical protein
MTEPTFDFPKQVGSLGEEARLRFYECLSHDLTIVNRSIWSDADLSDADKVEQMKWLNEILHRVTAKTCCLRRRTHEWTEQDFGSLVQEYVASTPAIGPLVNTSLWRCFTFTIKEGEADEGK